MSLTEPERPDRDRVQVLDDEGRVLPGVDPPDLPESTLLGMYEDLRLARHFDERAVSLQRQGRIGTYAPMRGGEAAQVGSARALADGDWVYPTYRDHAAKFVRGVDPEAVVRTLAGDPAGHAYPEDVRVMPEYIPIATQLPQAVGAAMARRQQGDEAVVLAYHGDGATSEGDFHEALNFAGVFDAPVVFVCNNNQWAISTPVERQTRSETLAGKADAYGLDGVRVDGTDPLATYEVTRAAVAKARDPGADELRPTLIEALHYRVGAHSTADDPSVYRDGVPEEWDRRDPLDRFEAYLRRQGLLDDERVATVTDRVEDRVAAAITPAEAADVDPDAMFEHVYAEPTPELARQRERFAGRRDDLGGADGGEVSR